MKFSFPKPGGGTGLSLFSKLIRTKDLRQLQHEDPRSTKPKLKKCLTTLDLTSLGIGSCCGTGMYLVAGMVARNIAGPGVILSFVIAAVASIFSGACYAEFGVRAPHTSGSAYMYSYVSVGEFVAFVIGWNMILEYLIGTSACACALSASFDSLSGGSISKSIGDTVGTLFGRAPDFIAFGITMCMTCVMALGASKSVIFNNVLNAVNLATWVFIMAAGLFYVDTKTWEEHEGFLPYGWSGVFTGAATCFYAFIGFDIIATTGEEANNPQKSIPKAIVGSLVIVLIAYVSSSLILTLTVPYDQIDPGSALLQMWSYVGATKCRAIVSVGATAGLTVAMFGSMFPMPRVIYAMAQDGLIFKNLAQIWQRTGAPGIATLGSGIAAGLVSLIVRLEVLVEMMSIGTLLAYTLVSTCVLILRYQPHSTSLIDLLPAQLRTPQPPSTPNINLPSEVATKTVNKNVIIRKVTTRSDSDDSFGEDSPDGYLGCDDQFLVSDKSETKFYGSVHGAPTGNAAPFDSIGLGVFGRKLQEYAYLCPGLFPWINPGPATHESGMHVTRLVGIMYVLIFFMDLFVAIGVSGTFFVLLVSSLFIGIIIILLLISRQPQNRYALAFLTPGLPFIPTVAITVNIYLIFKLSILTLVRFTVWMSLGLVMYFYYGIKNSTLETATDDIELTIDQNYVQPQVVEFHQTAVWDRHGYENKMAEDTWSQNNYASGWSNAWNETSTTVNPSSGVSATGMVGTKPIQNKTQSSSKQQTQQVRQPPPPAPQQKPQSKPKQQKPTQQQQQSQIQQQQQQSSNVTNGFGLFIEETHFPKWDD